jgi:hypothetical protein
MQRGSLIDKFARVERDEGAPDWARGYKLEDVRRITTLFNHHDEGLLHGPFDRYRDRDAANDLHNGWLKLDRRDAEGVPVWACVVRELDRKQPVRDFTGARVTLSPGTLYCTRMAFADENAGGSILAQLQNHTGPIAVECWQEHPGERALVTRLRAIDATGQSGGGRAVGDGMRLAAVKIKESSAIRGLWVSHDIPDPPWASQAGERYSPYSKQELLGLAELPVELPQNAILALRSHQTVCDESAYAAHHLSYATDDTSTALALRGFCDELERVEKPSAMDRRWKSQHEPDLDREPRDTQLWAVLGAAVEKILVAPAVHRVRADRPDAPRARRRTGPAHRHYRPRRRSVQGQSHPCPHPADLQRALRVPVLGLDGSRSTLVMKVGSAYYLDTRKPHAVVNGGNSERIHLVVDCIANAKTVEMLRNATQASLDESNERL